MRREERTRFPRPSPKWVVHEIHIAIKVSPDGGGRGAGERSSNDSRAALAMFRITCRSNGHGPIDYEIVRYS